MTEKRLSLHMYCVDKKRFRALSPHDVCQAIFGNKLPPGIATCDVGASILFYSASQIEVLDALGLSNLTRTVDVASGAQFHVMMRVNFDKRGKHGNGKPKINSRMNATDAVKKVLTAIGCESDTVDSNAGKRSGLMAQHLSEYNKVSNERAGSPEKKDGTVAKGRVILFNSFEISGVVRVADPAVFCAALVNGVGSRKSYGFGFIYIPALFNT